MINIVTRSQTFCEKPFPLIAALLRGIHCQTSLQLLFIAISNESKSIASEDECLHACMMPQSQTFALGLSASDMNLNYIPPVF